MLSATFQQGDTIVIGESRRIEIILAEDRTDDGRAPDVAVNGVISRFGYPAWTYVRLGKPYEFGPARLTFLNVTRDNKVEIEIDAPPNVSIGKETIKKKKVVRTTLQ